MKAKLHRGAFAPDASDLIHALRAALAMACDVLSKQTTPTKVSRLTIEEWRQLAEGK